jgi:hypothetical protein
MRVNALAASLLIVFTAAVLTACGGNGVSPNTASPSGGKQSITRFDVTPTPSPTPNSRLTKVTGYGQINGNDTLFPGGGGEESNDGDYAAGGHGPVNTTIGPDNVPCLSAMYTGKVEPYGPGYHVHAFLGIYYNGLEVAVPDGLGFANPAGDGQFNVGLPNQTPPNWTQYAIGPKCYYQMHTHDASGTLHIESATAPANGQNGTLYTLGDLLAIWGIPVSATNWGPLNGAVQIYTSGQFSRGHQCYPHCYVYSNTYTPYAGDPTLMPLYSHEVIWVLVGTGNPTGSSLPNVLFWDAW